jgi:hypothetical protein
VLDHFRNGGFRYTLEPPLLGRDSVDDFLFDTRLGYCEHYASAFVVLMRALDVPARVVTGYQGGEMNPVDGFMTVRQSDAHAWAEVWLAGRGWTRIDPTAVVALAVLAAVSLRHRTQRDPLGELMARVRAKLADAGIMVPAHLGPRALLAQLQGGDTATLDAGSLAETRELVGQLERWRYSRSSTGFTRTDLRALRRRVRRYRPRIAR